jgi:RecA-family ATPase
MAVRARAGGLFLLRNTMPYYYCSLPNKGCPGRPVHLISDDAEAITAFVKRRDVPGRAVYYCPNPLKAGATARNLETVAQVDEIWTDHDFKDFEDPPEEVTSRLLQLPLEPTTVNNSGHGLHSYWKLREPIAADDPVMFARVCDLMKNLATRLSADPMPTTPASLMRVVGTHNTKDADNPVLVTPAWGSGQDVDITDLEELCDTLPADGLFRRRPPKPRPNGNGDASSGGDAGGPVDINQRLEDMCFEGPGDSSIHCTQLQCTAALLRGGCSVDEAVIQVLEATQKAVANEPKAGRWNWAAEERDIRKMCTGFIKKNPELVHLLVDDEQKPGKAPEQEKPRRPVEARPFKRFDPAALPPREWLYGKHYQRGVITATVGPGGGGKSSLSLVELIAMCTGRPLLDEQPEMRCRAWYHNAEDGRDEIYRRIAAICQHYDIDQGELEGWLFVTSGLDMPIKIATSSSAGTVKLNKVVAEAIIGTIADNEIMVASFDPLVAHHAGVENATGDMDQIIREFARIAHATDCGIDAVHHTRKAAPGQEELSVADSRGAGAIINAVRSARVLNVMAKSEAETAGVDEVDRRLHFRIDTGKANMAPPTASRWHKFIGVDLPNGDNVGIATPWLFPGQEGSFSPQLVEAERAADHVFMSLLVRFTLEGRSVSDRSGTNYAPHLFAEQAEAKVAKATKARLKAAMNRLFAAKRVRVERKDKRGGRAGYVIVIV